MAEKTPNHAQVFYLLGYLREQQGRYEEAAAQFRKAIQIDPDYLNAWEKLLALASRIPLPHEEREAAALSLFRLDPLGTQASHDFKNVLNFASLWKAILESEARLPEKEEEAIYPLVASKAELEKSENKGRGRTYYDFNSRRSNTRERFASAPLITAVTLLIEESIKKE
ncbi:MAG: tetratricopeptide repeat protein [Akkermansiaceae bacterium]|nr:tetratricopeptide repeat protein [Akkermansiaceae bacterium]